MACLTRHTPSQLVRIEARALLALADRVLALTSIEVAA